MAAQVRRSILEMLPEEMAAPSYYQPPTRPVSIRGWRNYSGIYYSQTPDLFSSISLAEPEQFDTLGPHFDQQRRIVIGHLTAELLSRHDNGHGDRAQVVRDSDTAIRAYGLVAVDRARAERGLESSAPIVGNSNLEHKVGSREEEAKRMLLAGGAIVRVTFHHERSYPVWADVEDVMQALEESQLPA